MRKILIVEDNAANRGALARLLRLREFSVIETGTLAEAKFAAAREEPNCIVLDLNLPDSGTDETIGAITGFSPVPVIAYTGVEDPTLFSRVSDAGASAIITKGSPSETIIEKILLAIIKSEPGEAEDLGRDVWSNRRENHHMNAPRQTWWTTTKILAATLFAVVGQAIVIFVWIWNQGGKDALREKTISDTASIVEKLAPDVAHLKEQATVSINDRADLHAQVRQQADSMASMRKDMNDGFGRLQDQNSQILRLMIEQRSANPIRP